MSVAADSSILITCSSGALALLAAAWLIFGPMFDASVEVSPRGRGSLPALSPDRCLESCTTRVATPCECRCSSTRVGAPLRARVTALGRALGADSRRHQSAIEGAARPRGSRGVTHLRFRPTCLPRVRHGDAIVGDRLPRRGRGRDGHGLHGRPDRSRGRARHARRPSPRGRRALAGRLSVRPAPSGVVVLRRRVDRARRAPCSRAARRRGSRNGPVSRRSRPTTTTSCIAASSARAASPSSGAASTTRTAPPIS